MVDFVLGRLKFTYQGNWTTSFAYIKDDIVTYGGQTYVCVTNHTSNSSATGGFYSDSANWNLIAGGTQYKGAWTTGTYYKVNDLVKYGADIWICTTGHTAGANFQATESNFVVYVNGLEFVNSYNGSTQYTIGDIVTYGGYVYQAKTDTLGNLPTNATYWSIVTTGYNPRGAWSIGTAYKIGDTVIYGAYSYIAAQDNTGQTPASGSSYWTQVSAGTKFIGVWSNSTGYKLGDIVTYGAYSYVALQDGTNQNPATAGSYWQQLNPGSQFRSAYSGSTAYNKGDIVTYGAYSYISLQDTTGNLPTNVTYWSQLGAGSAFLGVYSGSTAYHKGDIVTYGGNSYVATQDTTGNLPTNATYWTTLVSGFSFQGPYSGSIAYKVGQVVTYSGYSYICIQDTSAGVVPSNDTYWAALNSGFNWTNTWSNTTTYQTGDVASYGGSSYISVGYNNINHTPSPGSNTYWQLVAQGTTANLNLTTVGDTLFYDVSGLDRLPIGSNNSILTSNGTVPTWGNPGVSANAYYVSPNGVDAAGYGSTIQRPFRTIQYATQQVSGLSTIFVKTGTYTEQLPIVVPPNTTILGETMRTTIVQPNTGVLSNDGINNNENSQMFQMSDGTSLSQLTFKGMTGFVPSGSDITAATLKGAVIAFNPASPILTKSPYIVYCSSICTKGIGALIDGSVHASGNKSMLFHSFTNIADNGVGIYAKDNGKAEVVSCFTYFAYFGYAASGGGKIRSLNGNHSYGNYGSYARGYDTTEISSNGVIYGDMLTLNSNAVNYNVGETIVGGTSGAQGTVTAVQTTAGTVYYYRTTANTFTTNERVTGQSTGYIANTLSSNSVTGQGGYVLVVSGLPQAPGIGQSLNFTTGDTQSYIIQNYSGTYTNTSSIIQIVLTSQKVTASSNGAAIQIRSNFSNIRLTGHDFLSVGTGNTVTSAYPNVNNALTIQAQETVASSVGRVYYTSTDQDGNFRVGSYFAVNQATGAATLNASAFNLSGLTSLRLGSIGAQVGELISEFSSDGLLSANSNSKVPTQQAVKSYVDNKAAETFTLDDISSQFNGAQTTFTLTYSNNTVTSANISPTDPNKLQIFVGNVLVNTNPNVYNYDYVDLTEFQVTNTYVNGTFNSGWYLSGNSNNIINFATPPLSGMSFNGYWKTGIGVDKDVTYAANSVAYFSPLNIAFGA